MNDEATDRARRWLCDEPVRDLLVRELRLCTAEAEVGRGSGNVELKEGVEKIDEGRSAERDG